MVTWNEKFSFSLIVMIRTVTRRLFSTLTRRMSHKNDFTNTLDYNWTEADIAAGIDSVLNDTKEVKLPNNIFKNYII